MELVFINEIVRDVGEFNSDVLWAVERGAEVKIADVVACKFGVRSGEGTVDDELDGFEGSGLGAAVPWVTNSVAADSDTRSVGVLLLWADLTDYTRVGDVDPALVRDVGVLDGTETVCAGHALLGRVGGVAANALTEAAQFVSIRLVPEVLVFWVAAKLAVFQCLSRVVVEDGSSKRGVILVLIVAIR